MLEAGIDASIGAVGNALDNALMESQIALYKTEPHKPRRPWDGLADAELDTAEWVDWFKTSASIPPSGPPAPRTRDQPLRSAPAPTGGWRQRTEPRPIPERFSERHADQDHPGMTLTLSSVCSGCGVPVTRRWPWTRHLM
ncbi:integrase core domain-containing protein [Streptomyces sp. NPDC001296]